MRRLVKGEVELVAVVVFTNSQPRERGIAAMDDIARKIVERATVRLQGLGGLGVLVGAQEDARTPGFILTAAHCVKHYNTGGMALGEHCLERILTHDEQQLLVSVCIVEPVTDIAVLEEADSSVLYDTPLYDQAEGFMDFCESTTPVPICTVEPGQSDNTYEEEFPIHIFTHGGTWIEGTAKVGTPDASTLCLKAPIESGTSGGPVVNELGELVAVVSWSGGVAGGTTVGLSPRPHRALPIWVWGRIAAGSDCRTNIDSPN